MKAQVKTVATFGGKVIQASQVSGFAKKFSGLDRDVTLWVAYGVAHAMADGNLNPLNNMLANAAFRTESGAPSAFGRDVAKYVEMSFPCVQVAAKTGIVSFYAKKDRIIVNPLDESKGDDKGEPFAELQVDFRQWKNRPQEKAEPKVTVDATAVKKQIDGLLEKAKKGNLQGSTEEKAALCDSLKALFGLLFSELAAPEQSEETEGEQGEQGEQAA